MKRALSLEIVRGTTSYTIKIDQTHGVIGRGPNADIRIPFSTVSSSHLEFKSTDGLFYFRDLGSTNGTLFEDTRLAANHWIEIKDETILSIVDTQLIFRPQTSQTPNFTMVQSGTLARKLLMDSVASDEDAYLEALSTPNKGVRLTLHDGVDQLEIGSATGTFHFPPLSSAHIATILRDGDGFSILPVETIYVDGVPTTKKTALKNDCRIEMGKVSFRFLDPLEAYFSEFDENIEFETEAYVEGESEKPYELPNAEPIEEKPSASQKVEPALEQESEPQPEPAAVQKKRDWLLIFIVLLVLAVGSAAVASVLSI